LPAKSWQKEESIVTEKPMPIFPGLIGESFEPGRFECIETWELWLVEVQAMPESLLKEWALESAKRMIAMKRQSLRAWRHGVEWLH
jgi:hypothetical protein